MECNSRLLSNSLRYLSNLERGITMNDSENSVWELQICMSVNRYNTPQEFETFGKYGSARDLLDTYENLSHVKRVSDAFQVVDPNGTVLSMSDFLYQTC
jgi:hypothetical protein